MNVKTRTYARFLAVFILIGGLGIAGTVYTLVNERFPVPFGDTYTVKVQFSAADGVISGLGQPVNVVGVKVGQVIGVSYADGRSLVTLELNRRQVPRVYSGATVVLEPITPLQDLQISLSPGRPPAPALPAGATIPVSQTTVPVPLSDLLSSLDADTRTYVSSLIASLDQGTQGRGPGIRRALQAIGPTTTELGQISGALAARRIALARVVHNLALVTRAASQDHQLASVVAAGDQTLSALAAQQSSLRQAIAKLPPTLSVARATLADLQPFARQLRPTLTALLPSVNRLPHTLSAVTPFATLGTTVLKRQLRPLIQQAIPVVEKLAPTVPRLVSATPNLSGAFQALEYFVNELAFNPNTVVNGSRDEGLLFWLDWGVHNWDSVLGSGDANGGIGRVTVVATCQGAQDIKALQSVLKLIGLCPV